MGVNIPTLLVRSQYHMLRYLLYGQVWKCRFYRLLGFERIRSRHFLSQSKQDRCWSFSSYLLRKSIGFKNDFSKSGLGKVLIEIKSLSIEVRKKFSLCNCPDKISQISILLSIAARKWCRKLQFSWPEGRLIEYLWQIWALAALARIAQLQATLKWLTALWRLINQIFQLSSVDMV